MIKIVVNGTFDILHLGHLQLLNTARAYPNSYVLVLIDSDRRVKELKGNDRPINTEYERAWLLWSLRYVDRVEIFDSDDELRNYIKEFEPDIMIKGSDYEGKPIIGSEYCKQIRYYPLNGHSTTKTIQRIINR
jgi:D-beta-D-heptose 7-phosphate kinase/D-beta-D-heptose 1-phosphate adenosyltransferase